ncbi:MAG: hypothetical protein ACREV9_05355 [Burkholderiales bacterium]
MAKRPKGDPPSIERPIREPERVPHDPTRKREPPRKRDPDDKRKAEDTLDIPNYKPVPDPSRRFGKQND